MIEDEIRGRIATLLGGRSAEESDTPSKAGGLMSMTAPRAGVLGVSRSSRIRIDRSCQQILSLGCTDVLLLAQSQRWKPHNL